MLSQNDTSLTSLLPMLVFVEYFDPLAAPALKAIPPRALESHGVAIDAVGIGPHWVDGVEKLGVLVVGDLMLADAVGVGHSPELALAEIILIRRIPRVSHGGPVEGDHRVGGSATKNSERNAIAVWAFSIGSSLILGYLCV